MLAAFGVYWTVFGCWFALGFVLSIYIHEMGHVAALMRYGVPATAPLFIPGLGAVIRLRQAFIDPREDARVGLAGPIWGCGAALACAGVYALTDYPLWGALARVGAWINLFNLTADLAARRRPGVPQPDPPAALAGGHGGRHGLGLHRGRALLVLVMAVGAFRAAVDKPADEPDRGALVQYIALVAVLSALAQMPVPMPGG